MTPHHALDRLTRLAGLALLAAAALPPAAAHADYPATQFTLSVSPAGVGSVPGETATLTCEPAGGSHPNAARACSDLDQAGGDFARLPGRAGHGICAMLYQPVTATATGTWRGQPVSYRDTYGNTCELTAATGYVFAFSGAHAL